MEYDIYKIEKLEIETQILSTLIEKFNLLLSLKVGRNTIAFREVALFLKELERRRKNCEEDLSVALLSNENDVSELKINIKTYEKLFSMKREFNTISIDHAICLLLDTFKLELYGESLSMFNVCEIPENLKINLRNSKFNIATSEDSKYKIIYATDDVVIHKNEKYLDLSNFKTHSKKDAEKYSFSPNFTLADLDDFFVLLFK